MNHTLSDIYKNFDYENRQEKSIEEMEITNYKGIECGQATGFHHLLNILFLNKSINLSPW